MHLEKIIENSLKDYLKEKLQSDMDKRIEKMMDNILENIFSPRSNGIYNNIKSQIEKKLDVNLRGASIINYNGMIVKSIGSYLKKQIEENSLKALESMISDIVWKAEKEEMTFKELLDLIHDELYNEIDYYEVDDWDMLSIYAEYKKNEYWKYMYIYCDTRADIEKEYCSMKLIIADNWSIISFQEKGYKGVPRWPHEFESMSNLWKKLYKMYVSGTKINFENVVYEDWEIEIEDRELSKY